MTPRDAHCNAQDQPGTASAEGGLVVLDGPDGVAVTMTPFAASETGRRLIEAARKVEEMEGRAD